MLSIRKIGESFYLVGGEYIVSNFNEAVIIANQNNQINGFSVKFMQANLRSYLKFKIKKIFKSIWYCINYPFKKLESWM